MGAQTGIRASGCLMALIGALLLANGGWIWAKAGLAQLLLERSWMARQAEPGPATPSPPWPWADTHPVARLQVPELGVTQLVLAGDSGRTLAFGPGLSSDSALPGQQGPTVISGHRDTHFRFLRHVTPGMRLSLQTPQGEWRYRISTTQVVNVDAGPISLPQDLPGVLLVTCYPFDTLEPGGPLRLLVWAEHESTLQSLQPESGTVPAFNRL